MPTPRSARYRPPPTPLIRSSSSRQVRSVRCLRRCAGLRSHVPRARPRQRQRAEALHRARFKLARDSKSVEKLDRKAHPDVLSVVSWIPGQALGCTGKPDGTKRRAKSAFVRRLIIHALQGEGRALFARLAWSCRSSNTFARCRQFIHREAEWHTDWR